MSDRSCAICSLLLRARRRSTLRTAVAGLLLAAAFACPAQNMLANGDFDADLTGWIASGSPPAVWDGFDVDNRPGSGSALLTNQSASANQRLYPLRQCIESPPVGSYVLYASGYLVGGTAGRLVISYGVHNTSDCSGTGFTAIGGYYLGAADQWQRNAIGVPVDHAQSSIEVSLGIEKDPAGGQFQGYIDAVHLLPDAIFADGFEGI